MAAGEWSRSTQGESFFEVEDGEGEPSRWITLIALRVLDWSTAGA